MQRSFSKSKAISKHVVYIFLSIVVIVYFNVFRNIFYFLQCKQYYWGFVLPKFKLVKIRGMGVKNLFGDMCTFLF